MQNRFKFLEIKEKAELLAIKHRITSPPVPVTKIVNAETNLSIAETKFYDSKISGFIDFEQLLILVNKLDAFIRKRFTIAHELAHWILHREEVKINIDRAIFYRKTSYLEDEDILEKEANYFAANLLVPEFLLKEFRDYSDSELADLFRVSEDVIKLRKIDYTGVSV